MTETERERDSENFMNSGRSQVTHVIFEANRNLAHFGSTSHFAKFDFKRVSWMCMELPRLNRWWSECETK